MAKIKIKDLPKDYKITEDEMKRIRGGLLLTSSEPQTIDVKEQEYKLIGIKWY